MLNLPFLKYTIKSNYRIWLFFTVIMSACMVLTVSVFSFEGAAKLLDPELSEINARLAWILYGFLYIVIPMVYETIIANRLVAKQVEEGSMAYYISAQNTRKKIASTQSYFLLMSLFVMFLCTSVLGILFCHLWKVTDLNIQVFLLMNLGVYCLHVCISGISFLASCICDQSTMSLLIGAGLPILCYVIYVFEAILETGILKYITIFTLFSPQKIMEGSIHICWSLPLLAVTGLLLHRAGVGLFKRRDLPL